MSDSQLMTNWICVCAEGDTVDGRDIKRQWIMDAAELYDPNLYTALLWPEHSRNYGNRGRVLAAMCQEGDDGIMRLYVQLCPNISLMQANAEGQLLFCSAEFTPDGNFRGTGKSYLEGLGVTDSPASVYTERMRFSKRHKNKRYGALKPLAFDEVKEIKEEVKMSGNKKKGWRSMFSIEEEPQQPEIPADGDKLQALAEALADFEARLSALEGKAAETANAVEEVQEDVDTVKEVVDTQEFKTLRDNIGGIVKNFSKLDKQITQLPSRNPGKGRKPFTYL
ncbi:MULTISPECIES: GPO family capsid scaffolding protein [Serratia]|uniref:GPO family capsid scaffolding protein n=1 Tax=Serratia TaxID=613 RepID=UPI002179E252|nr:GPO family capsid scaffolding protein [Serratia marcescens]MDP8703782.1 GPO family capsid scaffolding protein [Serratia marcescens]MDU6300135.1 GPO family capsid scaffolding protein [Serratia marcescens]CAI0924646.1 Phage capsid scaffolding protein (GPO) serine peptidase [Serratia marcescens]CAI1690838.1 Phage capsid scaffolding protein (GPO) serine peptidase [Serratia marcescens]